jgi:hypothetical protein
MTIIYNNLRAIFADDPNVFVAMDLLWYPVEGNPRIRVAPDVLVALGRPKGHRGSYKQWRRAALRRRWCLRCCRRAIARRR